MGAALASLALHGCDASQADVSGDGGVGRDGTTQDANAADGADGTDAAGGDGAAPSCEVTPITLGEPDLLEMCGSEPTTLEAWEQCYMVRACEWALQCGHLLPYRDIQECMEWRDALSDGRLAAARRERHRAVQQGRASIDEDAFARCLQELDPSHCHRRALESRLRPACAVRFVGTVEDGGACYGDVECASPGANCVRGACADGCCEGTCEPAIVEGGDCFTGQCEPGLACVLGDRCSDTGHSFCCLPVSKVGEPCSSSNECEAGAWCDGACGICRNASPEGGECTTPRQCAGRTECVGLSIIHADPGRCVRVSEPGDDCDSRCHGPLHCGPFLSTNPERTCRPLEELGEYCGTHVCLGATSTCQGSGTVCVERTPEGAPCADGPPWGGIPPCMPGLFCTAALGADEPACAAPQEPGALCTHPRQCASHRCSGDATEPGTCLAWSESCP
jgi:hypothetical protein